MTDVIRVAVIGDKQPRFVPQETIESSLAHSGARLGVEVEVTWHATTLLKSKDLERTRAQRDTFRPSRRTALEVAGVDEVTRIVTAYVTAAHTP